MLHAPSCVELFLQCNRQFSLLVLRYGRGFLTFYYKIHSLSRYLFSAGSFLNTPVKFSLINSSFNQTVLSLSGSKNLLSHIHSREKGGFQIIQKLLRTSGSQPDCSASADPRPRWKAGRDNRLCQSCEEGLPPQSIVAVAFCLHSSRAIMIGAPPMKNTWLVSRFRPRRAPRYRLPDDMPDRRLETTFSLFYLRNLDKTAVLRYDKYRNPNAPQSYFLSFGEIHISQAQVSRLEKGALAHIRDGLA